MIIQLKPFAILPGSVADHVSEAITRRTMAESRRRKQAARDGWQARRAELRRGSEPSPPTTCSPSFRAEVERIANDYIPENSGQASLALEEMREALQSLLANAELRRGSEPSPPTPGWVSGRAGGER